MRNCLFVGFLFVACGLCLIGPGANPPAPAVAQAPAKRVQWQYAVYYHSDLMALGGKTIGASLSKLGADGWELVSVVPGITGEKEVETKQTTFIFKRMK
jgi:hypothetical protein